MKLDFQDFFVVLHSLENICGKTDLACVWKDFWFVAVRTRHRELLASCRPALGWRHESILPDWNLSPSPQGLHSAVRIFVFFCGQQVVLVHPKLWETSGMRHNGTLASIRRPVRFGLKEAKHSNIPGSTKGRKTQQGVGWKPRRMSLEPDADFIISQPGERERESVGSMGDCKTGWEGLTEGASPQG